MSKEELKRHGIGTPAKGEKYGKVYVFGDGSNTLYVYAHSSDGSKHEVSIRNSGLMSNHKAINSLIDHFKSAPIEEEQIDELKGIKNSNSRRRAYLSKATKDVKGLAAQVQKDPSDLKTASKGLRRAKYGLKAAMPDIQTLASLGGKKKK